MSDQAARLRALNPRESFIVEAPAGSGKTDLLVKRYLKLLETVQRPEEILAITFTRKAAREMRERVLAAMGADFNAATLQMMTIDSFCRFVVGQVPLQSPVLTAAMLEDEASLKQIFLNTLLDIIEKQEEGAADLCALFQYFDNQLSMVCDLLFDILKSREEWLPIVLQARHHGDANALQEICLQKLHQAAWQEWQQLEPAAFRASFGDECDLKAIADRLLTQKDELRKAIKQDVPQAFIDFLIKVRRLPEPQAKADSLLPILLRVLPLAAAHLQVLLQEHQWTDFHDIALSAVNLLETEPEIMRRLDTKIRHILVDEFQDTSNLQFRLLQAVTADWQEDDGRTLFLVGDPKQSIYGFRHANVGLFLQARAQGIGAIKLTPLLLRQNFRSDQQIVRFINQAGQQLFPAEVDPVLGKVVFMASDPQCEFPGCQGVQQHFFAQPQQEAAQIALQIAALQAAGSSQRIAILVRARSHFADIIVALHQAGIAYQVKEDRHWLAAPLVDDLMSLLYSLQHLGNRLAWMALLRSPFCGLGKADLLRIADLSKGGVIWSVLQADHHRLSADGQRRVGHLVAGLYPILEGASRHLSLYLKWRQVWQALAGESIVKTPQEARIVEIITRYLCLCQTLPAYAEFKAQLAAFDPGEMNAETQGVLLLTIHQSKGLEFDHVFLPALNRQPSRSDSPILLSQLFYVDQQFYFLLAERAGAGMDASPIYEYLKWLNAQRGEQEILRLLYVAMTRAKQSLWLSAVIELDAKNEWKLPAKSFLKYLAPCLNLDRYHQAESLDLHPADAPLTQGIWRLKAECLQVWKVPELEPPAQPQLINQNEKERALGEWIHQYLECRAKYQKIPRHLVPCAETLPIIQKLEQSPTAQWLWAAHEEAHSEWPLVSVNAQGVLVKNIIDRSFVEDGVRYIIDYKVTQPQEDEALEGFLVRMKRQYLPQLQHYQQLLERAGEIKPIRLALYFPILDRLEYC